MQTRNAARTLPVFVLAMLAACGPCEANIVTIGDVDLCPGGGGEGTTGDTTDASTGNDPTEGGLCSIDDGDVWGRCVDGGCPNAAVPSVCVVGELGAVCEPYCNSGCTGHLDADCYGAADGVCSAPGAACHFPCNGWCPNPGMVCDTSINDGACVWPTESMPQTCEGSDIPGQPFAPCLAGFTCDAPGTICATDSNRAVCIPISSDNCAEEHAACAGPLGFGTGYGAQVDACTLTCTADTDCAVDGMVCGPTFGLCLWPN